MSDWLYCGDYGQVGKIVESQTLWGETIHRVWLPGTDAVVRVPDSRLRPLNEAHTESPHAIAATVAAARVAETLTQDILLAPMEAPVIPLPHQLQALSRAVSGDRVRFLLADEVGLGKTIEAGLILRELKLRGLVRRTLVVAPAGLVPQWQLEMRTHFGESFTELRPGAFLPYHLTYPDENVWQFHNQMICPLDSVKPLERRKGWDREELDDHNRWRFHDLVSAGWDLVIVDEAHRLGGSSEQVARHKLGVGLSEAAPYMLLLSATPHQGKSDAFHRLVSLLDPDAFPDADSVTRERLAPYVIRTEKRHAIDADGKPLFRPRVTELSPVSWQDRHHLQRELYHAVSEYVRTGYNRAIREKRGYETFLLILMQRLVVSSTGAIRDTLEKRLAVLSKPTAPGILFPDPAEDDWAELDGQAQLDAILTRRQILHQNERREVQALLDAAARCESDGPDAKAEVLLSWLYRLRAESGDPELKTLIFTEFVSTQDMLRRFLEERGFSVVCLNGSLDVKERRRVQDAFADDARILLSTDAGGEGLNLQFCHTVINYDIPWNPMRLEQRIGRVDRIGQNHTVRAINLIFEESVERRVREVLEQKLVVIRDEFGVDKTEDVLMSSPSGQAFDDLYLNAILHPDQVERSVDDAMERWKREVEAARKNDAFLDASVIPDPGAAKRFRDHPLPHWVERMTVAHVMANGGDAKREKRGWRLRWPDGEVYENTVFTLHEAEANPVCRHITLEDPKVRGIAMRLARFVPAQPIPMVVVPGLARDIRGDWSLWRIGLSASGGGDRRIISLFLDDADAVYLPTARQIWERLIAADTVVRARLEPEVSTTKLERMAIAAEEHGKDVYESLAREYLSRLAREREKNEYAFSARRAMIRRIGLPEVRDHRLSRLAKEERLAKAELERKALIAPELTPIIALRVEGGGDG